mmetsp:Transcript_35939/g.49881  ORF Transcript_35939/g.49881 Transcript_35939/m.49881 type:complete len:261 (+) Transcript_35939:113-895(+)|eukprot:CAMPEP_0196585932 /NCGR_PEP_ID=MMETSP1081-20130531/52578_1 /TAXON_ID=36882 /ORGANISM="Pyramimonas amylifera, Strain CCMP720" /LENGTH=260 /DNA_ID=CAMNT_0041907641 /DNA_START=111 /DNA_END=893 /DNA_ORIENTATION=-
MAQISSAAHTSTNKLARHVVITGASSGVGAAVAKLLASTSTGKLNLYLCGRNKENLSKVSEDCVLASKQKDLLQVSTSSGDVRDSADVARMWQEFGAPAVDVLVANAGVNRPGALHTVSEAEFDEVMDTNLKGVFLWLQKVIPGMIELKSGQIVVTNSVLGMKPAQNASLYCASKFALDGLVGSLREEVRPFGVKVGQVYPAGIATAWWDDPARGGSRPGAPDTSEFLSAEDVASAILSLINQPPRSDIDKVVLRSTCKQ